MSSALAAAMSTDPSKEQCQESTGSSSIGANAQQQTGVAAKEPIVLAVPATTTTASPGRPVTQQNSIDDLDGYRSSYEESVPDEGCHGSHENNSLGSSTGLLENSDVPLLSSHILAELTKGEPSERPQRAAHSRAVSNSSSGDGGGDDACFLPTHPLSTPHPHHRRHLHSLPQSSIGSAAREEERQRLIAMSSTNELKDAVAAGDAAGTAPTDFRRSVGNPLNAEAAIAPISLAEASAADSDSFTADAVCHGPHPVFASTSVKTAAAMLSVALDSESREEVAPGTVSADAVGEATNGTGMCNAVAAGGVDSTGSSTLQRVIPPLANSQGSPPCTRSLSSVETTKSLLQPMLSRLSLSSSNSSTPVEATVECIMPPVPTPACRSSSTNAVRHDAIESNNNENRSNARRTSSICERGQVKSQGAGPCTPAMAPSTITAEASDTTEAPKLYSPTSMAKSSLADAAAKTSGIPVIFISSEASSGATAAAVDPPQQQQQQQYASSDPSRKKTVPNIIIEAAAETSVKDLAHAASATSSCVNTVTNKVSPSFSRAPSPLPSHLLAPNVDLSSSSSVGGHHLSVTEGSAFLKQSGSRREEAFYNMIRPYQETLVREAVRQAPHTVEHWRHHTSACSHLNARHVAEGEDHGSGTSSIAKAEPSDRHAPAPAAAGDKTTMNRRTYVDNSSIDCCAAMAVSQKAETASLCDARWEAYQQIVAEDLSSLMILASGPPTTEEEMQHFTPLHRMRRDSVVANSPVMPGSPEYPDSSRADVAAAVDAGPVYTHPTPQVDRNLVDLAARLWWTIRFRHLIQASSTAYEVQRQMAEAISTSPPSPSTSSAAGAGRDVVCVSRCSTPASPDTNYKDDGIGTPTRPQMPLPSSVPIVLPPSGTATPSMVGSFAAPCTESIGSSVSLSERQYNAQKHRALQLLATFVPRYHGTRRLFVKDVLQYERRGMAAAAAAAAVFTSATPASAAAESRQNPLTACHGREEAGAAKPNSSTAKPAVVSETTSGAAASAPRIIDADNDDDDDEEGNEAGGSHKICRMIMLEYVCYKFRRPCVMDIKMGSRQYGLHPTAEKKRSKEQKAKLSTSARYGIRLAGYRRWNAAESRYTFRSKLQCRTLTLNEVNREISAFMLNNRELKRVYRRQLQRLRIAFSQQTVFRFYTSSLLFVYDAEDPLPTARVTMVDFAYTYESRELLQGGDSDADFAYDVGYLKAIDTLLSLLA
ncbi:putative inositol polyphosphate kinase-like protein [Leptomonas seymouri]|uniref:Kinase n=1 Tax=Leptomonas seymouri TaxID=5684 RepID=A0A0N0P2Y6_LEPSE|nr:putative inositol polyphosphate kinase-like protein [Leptomonas seymouri]|eukprot:KPI83506.1 putative inositol polyphosphate kinase-like protein [Leptomonas seymouri]